MTYDCRRCGACCASPWWSETVADFDFSRRADRKRAEGIPDSTKRRVLIAPSRLMILAEALAGGRVMISTGSREDRHGNCVCSALRGSVNNGAEGKRSQCSCSIYKWRPGVCRKFKVGGQLCKEARREMGVRK